MDRTHVASTGPAPGPAQPPIAGPPDVERSIDRLESRSEHIGQEKERINKEEVSLLKEARAHITRLSNLAPAEEHPAPVGQREPAKVANGIASLVLSLCAEGGILLTPAQIGYVQIVGAVLAPLLLFGVGHGAALWSRRGTTFVNR